MKFPSLLVAVGAAIFAGAIPAAAQDDVENAPTISPVAISFSEEGFSGPGAEVLRGELANAQFVSIGEDHGYADPPLLVAAFAAEGADHGFDYYAIEVGPYSTDWLRAQLIAGGPDGLAKALGGRPLALPFLNSREEADAAMAFLDDDRLWGVDQEFVGSPLIHFEELEKIASEEGRGAIAEMFAKEKEAFATGNQGAVFLMSATDEQWEAVRSAFAGNAEATARIEALERSSLIYKHFLEGDGLANNLDRIELIREYFLSSYHATEERDGKPPKVVMKFGATHAGRSTSPMATFDIGSLVEGMAAANGMSALHVAYLPLAGEALAIRPSPEGAFSIKTNEATELREALEKAGVDLATVLESDGHYLVALEPVKRALRNGGLRELDGMTRFVVLGFDYLVTTGKGRPSTLLADK